MIALRGRVSVGRATGASFLSSGCSGQSGPCSRTVSAAQPFDTVAPAPKLADGKLVSSTTNKLTHAHYLGPGPRYKMAETVGRERRRRRRCCCLLLCSLASAAARRFPLLLRVCFRAARSLGWAA
ncbi:hypothetical protein JZ751_017949 [Albula glossodonta]|uniref:Uncharacterized protein n=1 Tax=Albula glossodonta TaxID=121402 RepID=A0A8T2PPX9_9TELE|nr:hypothetical protein JZ751_017949 [Albula glossodonta]